MIPVTIPQDYAQNIAPISQYFQCVRNGTLPRVALIEPARTSLRQARRTVALRAAYSHERNEQRASNPAALPTLPEELLVPARSKRIKESIFAMKKNVWRAVIEVFQSVDGRI